VNQDPIAAAAELLAGAGAVTLLAHVQPDADSLGSALALGIALHRRGVAVQVSFATPEQMPESLRILDVYGLVVPPDEVPAEPEVLVACDAAEPARLGALADRLGTARHSIMIDHHVTNPGFGQLQLLDPGAEASVVIVRRLLAAMDVPLDADVARCIYAGLVTDTSNFIAAGESAHRLAAELVAAGVDVQPLVRSLMYTHPYAWLDALGQVLQDAVLEPDAAGGLGLVHATVPCVDVERFRTEDVDSVVDMVRTIAEAEVAAVFKQVSATRWITSLRSDGRIDVATVAGRLGGGGHPGAAGFTWEGTAEELLAALRAALTAEPGSSHQGSSDRTGETR
jgi:bifunctional oligoribonuclease and PAP phosphatase NrnA